MRKFLISGAVVAAAFATPAAAQSITFVNGNYELPGFTTAAIFETFEGGINNTQFLPPAQSQPGSRPQTAVGDVIVASGNIPGQSINPDPGNDKYLAIGGGLNDRTGPDGLLLPPGAFTVNLAPGVTVFSFVFGTLDSYNSLQLFFSDGTNQIRTGQQIIGGPAPAPGAVFTSGETGRVTYDTNGVNTITSAVFTSSIDAFEIDSLAAAVPEPATWGMMILGFGLIGGQLRSRRRTKTTVSFA
jgi:hypothetical protein